MPSMKSKAGKNGEHESSYAVKDIVLAKIRGYPAWPGMVVDPEDAPPNVLKERPTNKKATFYCVRFFPAGDFAWTVAKDLSKLQKHEIEAFVNEPSKKNGELLQGYNVALDPEPWLAKKDAQAQEEADYEANAAVDQLDSEEDGDDEPKSAKSKKRKRESDAAPKAKAKAKPKKTSEEPGSKKKATGGAKGKKNGAKSKAMIESEDEGGPEAEDEDGKKPASPVAKKAKREKTGDDDALEGDEEAKRVREWRHKLQKAFLTPKSPPKPEDMDGLNTMFKSVEDYQNMTIEYLSFSKIGKVMRHIAQKPESEIPRNAEFNFLARAQTLVDKWHDILNSNKANGTPTEAKASNGDGTEVDTGAMEVDAAPVNGESASAAI